MESDPNADFFFFANKGKIAIGLIHAGWVDRPAVFSEFLALKPENSSVPATNGTVYTISVALNSLYETVAT